MSDRIARLVRRPRTVFWALALAAASVVGAPSQGSAQTDLLGADHDSSQPIEITADTLEVQQTEKIAIFRGDVDAIQGDMLLRADVLIVHYRETNDNPDDLGISRIDAEGNVFVSSPDETAQGSRGIYDVDNAVINLAGDVVLTQGDNVIQGDELVMDLESGKSQVISSGTTGGDRVRGLFVPQQKNN